MEHTALPWQTGKKHPCRIFGNKAQSLVATTCLPPDEGTEWPEQKQDAAYIVKSANLYPEMVEAIKSAMSLLETLKDNPLREGAQSEYRAERAMLERTLAAILQKIGEE